MDRDAAATVQHSRPSLGNEPTALGTADVPRPPRASVTVVEPFETTGCNPAQPRGRPIAAISGKVYRQILGLNPFKQAYLSLYSCLDVKDKTVACGAVLFAITAGLPLPIIGVIFGRLISSFPPSEDELNTRISQLLGVAVAYFVVTALYATAFGFTGEKISMRLRDRLLSCLLHLDQDYLDTHDIEVNGLLTQTIDNIQAGCSEKVGIFIQSISYFVAAFIVGFILSAKLTGILLAAIVPALTIVVALTSTSVSKLAKLAASHNEAANGTVESALRAIRSVQAFSMMKKICFEHNECLRAGTKASARKAIVSATQVGSIFFIIYSVNGLAFYVGSVMSSSGQHGGDAGTVFAVVFLILDSSLVVAQFAPLIDTFARAASAKEVIQGLLDAERNTKGSETSRQRHQQDIRGLALCFRGVSFAYPARPTVQALRKLHLDVRPGAFTAIVGTSGGGKSTLVSLLTRTYNYSGRIEIGSNELRDLEVADMRSQIAVVEQEPALFPGTIRQNICNGVVMQKLTSIELEDRCRQAVEDAAVDFLDKLPSGMESQLGDGLQLSGGQRQRICLARALIRRPAILVLDEPTAALDAVSEVKIVEAVKRAAASGTTVIMIAHRLSTVLEADHVAVFCDGSVVEQGKPQDLSEKRGIFRSMLDAQSTDMATGTPESSRSNLSEKNTVTRSGIEPSARLSDDKEDVEASSMHAVDELPPIGTKRMIAQIGGIIRPDLYVVCAGVFASVISGALLLGEAIVFGNLVQLLNDGVSRPDFQQNANFFCLMFFILACIALVSWVCSGTAFGIASTRSVARIQAELLSRLLVSDMQWFASSGRSVNHLMAAFTKDSGDLSCMTGSALGTIFTTTTSVIGGMVLALVVAWKIAVVLLAAVPVMLAAGFTRLRVLNSADARRQSAYRSATSFAASCCHNRRTVTVYGLEAHVLRQYRDKLRGPFQNSQIFTAWSNILLAASFAITYFVYALAYWWGSRLVRNGEYTGLQFFIVLPALLFSAQASGQLFSLSPEISRARSAARSVFNLLSHEAQILEHFSRKGPSASTTSSLIGVRTALPIGDAPRIAFEDVSLSYSGAKAKAVLHDANIQVLSGQTIALVGPSGAGKSSAISLMERFYDPSAGCVKLDGVDLRDLDVRSIRDRIGLVSQEPDLIPGSIAHNVKLGARSEQLVSDADVEVACKQCGLHDFIVSLPEGYATNCGTNGSSTLSGGQRQRLALARALIRDPEILLLDEPTSALDAHSEQRVKEALEAASHGRTTVIVAHRLASIQHVDKIYVLDNGSIVEEGTHAELVARGGLYASMAAAQSLS
ncbi:hypothetical protein LTR36_000598 [Oleoguttula mirabilis]|uniref:Uncharacterized protein n=1 Tax=Oleoguttula mirabilis TaxID=1507867 RepID=A0AAV9JQC9_9PEZI|nr:hypothetical protein LTR36_000598 [Oleoguttula mirabilis]